MTLVALFALVIAHILPWLSSRRKPVIDSPAKLGALLSGIQMIPQFAILLIAPDRSLIYGRAIRDLDSLLVTFGLLYALGTLAFYVGLGFGSACSNRLMPRLRPARELRRPGTVIAFLLIIYLLLMFQIFTSSGGLVQFVSNIGARASMLAGSGVFFIFSSPASYMIIFLAIFSYTQSGRPSLPIVFALIIFLTGIESLLGGRRQPVQMLIFAALAFSIFSSNFKIFSARNFILGLVAVVVFVVLLVVRVGENSNVDAIDLVLNLSHIDPYLFVMIHFQDHELWYGRSFLDVIQRVVPIYRLASPSPIDEGVYVYNLFLGNPVSPPTPMSSMSWNSWPAGSFGNGYMNFGSIGVLGFFFVRGVLISAAHSLSKKSGHSPALLLVYLWMAFGFHVSNLKITQLLMLLAGIAIILPVVSVINRVSIGRSYSRK